MGARGDRRRHGLDGRSGVSGHNPLGGSKDATIGRAERYLSKSLNVNAWLRLHPDNEDSVSRPTSGAASDLLNGGRGGITSLR